MSQLFIIENDRIVINKLALAETQGDVTHTGQLTVSNDLTVAGTLTAETIHVKNLITESGNSLDVGNWTVSAENDLYGKGFIWTWGQGSVQLQYRSGGKLWTNGDFDLDPERSYQIDGVTALSRNGLGAQVRKSNLTEVGALKFLDVIGHTTLAEFAFFNPNDNRLGLNTQQPNATLSIVENDIELIAGSHRIGTGVLGTYTCHDLEIITDNTARITVKNSGDVIFGNEATKTANVTIYGTLNVENIISDTRVNRYSSLEFKTTRDTTIYGQGLLWTGTGGSRQLIMRADPDRLWTTESIEVGPDKCFYVDGLPVLSQVTLGDSVTKSNLSKLGVLEELSVQGTSTFYDTLNASRSTIQANRIVFENGVEKIIYNNTGITATGNISIQASGDEVYYADANEIAIGNKQNTRRPVKVFGPLSVGINNQDPEVDFAVKGNVSFANKKFIVGESHPVDGNYIKGDVCWNQDPKESSYIGWVCVVEGTPGVWLPFGAIGK